ncbi:hypothetical protein [Agrococcus casei]|uniref:hypothetical protein n=1 Tax=Agrococcus casei TaxID=343512 RepID=UPI003F901B33
MTANDNPSPFKRPGFLIAASVVVLLIVAAVALGVGNLIGSNSSAEDTTPSPTTTATEPTEAAPDETESPEPTDAAETDSVCGLDGTVLEGRLDQGPETDWAYSGVYAYPTSDEYGPGLDNPVRHCFQHSPEGAVVMVANAIIPQSDEAARQAWLDHVLAPGPYQQEIRDSSSPSDNTANTDVRLEVRGFRLLEYTGDKAVVDIAVRGSSQGESVFLSGVYSLVWHEGDWKISGDKPWQPPSQIPDLSGYTSWGQ